MNIKVKQEKINGREKIFNLEHVHLVEQDIIVPDIYPDVIKILNVDVKSNITNIVKQNNTVVVQGRVIYYVMYKSADNLNKYRVVNTKMPYKFEVPVKEDLKDVDVEVCSNIIDVTYSIPNERKIYIKTDIEFNISGSLKKEFFLPVGIEESIEYEKKMSISKIENLIEEMENTQNSREEVFVKNTLPDIYEVSQVNYSLKNIEHKISYNKVIIKSDLTGSIRYIGKDDKTSIYESSFNIPITGFVEFSNAPSVNEVCVCMDIKSLETSLNPNNVTGSSIIMDIETKYKVILKKEKDVEYIEDLYFINNDIDNKLDYQKVNIKGGMTSNKVNLMSEVSNILQNGEKFVMGSIENQNINIKNNYLEGTIDVNLLIIREKELENRKVTINIKTESLENCNIISYELINTDISNNGSNITVNSLIDIVIETNKSINVFKNDEIKLIDCESSKYKSIIVYNVKKSDTIWEIAKKYKTTIKNIEKANENIVEDSKILIMR